MFKNPLEHVVQLSAELKSQIKDSRYLTEKQRIELCFAAALICRRHYETTLSSGAQGAMALACAVDFIDRTVPPPQLLTEIKNLLQENPQLDQLSILFANSSSIGAIPPALWKKPKGDFSFLGPTPAKLLNRIEKWLKQPDNVTSDIALDTLETLEAYLGVSKC